MSASIVEAIARIKRNVAECLTAASIVEVCHELQHCWRERELGPAQTVWAFLLQVLHGNTACEHVVRIAQLSCTASAYCAARARLPLAVVQRLLAQTSRAARSVQFASRWHGHRTFFVDGTSFSMPDSKALRAHFWSAGSTTAWLWFSDRACAGDVRCVHRVADLGTGRAATNARHVAGRAVASGAARGMCWWRIAASRRTCI